MSSTYNAAPYLVIQDVGTDRLVYDPRSQLTHCLQAEARGVLMLCDGTCTAEQIAAGAGISRPRVQRVLARLLELS